MSGRTYDLILHDPQKKLPPDVMEDCGLYKFSEEISVTSVKRPDMFPKGMLYSAISLTKEGKDPWEEWSGAAQQGTDVHSMFESLARFGPTDFDVEDFPPHLIPFAHQARDWWNTHEPTALKVPWAPGPAVEFPVWSREHAYAGRADAYLSLTYQGEELNLLIDFKTVGKTEHLERYPKGFRENRTELVARAKAMEEHGVRPDGCLLVRVSAEDHASLLIRPHEYKDLFGAFLRDLGEWRFQTEVGA